MNISEEAYYNLEKVFISRTAEFRSKDNLLFKYYYYLTKDTKDKLDYLLNKPYILGSGLPIDEFFIDGSFKGIVIKYFEDAVPFSSATNFSITEKFKACIDISRQLNILHSYGMCFNDIQSDNLLIDKDGGHLIDFDNSSFFGSLKSSCRYKLKDASGNTFLSSVEVDLYKALICYLSLFYHIDFFKELYACSDKNIFKFLLLFEGTSIFPLLNCATDSVRTNGDMPFPDIKKFMPFIVDEESFNYDLNKVKEKLKLLR